MKLTTLNKLEKKLRESRGREVPDLKPPTGGWEAIQAKIAADPAGERAPIDQPVASSLVKWWGGGAGVLLLVVAATFMLQRMKEPAALETDQIALQSLTMNSEGTSEVEPISMMAEPEKVPAKDKASHYESEANDLLPRQKLARAPKLAEKVVLAAQVDDAAVEEEQAIASMEVPVLAHHKPEVLVESNSGADPTAPERRLDEKEVVSTNTSQLPASASLPEPELLTDLERSIYLPLQLSSPLSGLELPAPSWPLALIPAVPENRGLFKRRRRLKARPEWQLHGSISGFVGEDFDATLAYNLAPAGTSGTFFVRPSGGLIHVEPNALRGSSNRLEQIYLKAGINRQTSSGFLFRSSIGLFRSKSFQSGQRGTLMSNQVEVKTAKNETIIPVELGLQYTFLRRRRIKPYAGVHLIGYLNYQGVDESYFREGATEEEGLVRRYSSHEFIAAVPDLAVTLGLQYQVSRRISAGAFLWGNVGGNFFVQAPIGMEIRYSLK